MSYAELDYFHDQSHGSVIFAAEEPADSERGFVQGPLRALMSALLFDGVIVCMNYACAGTKNGRSKFQEAFRWISTRGDDYVFSFDNVCQCLGIDADSLRSGLTKVCGIRRAGDKKSRRTF